MPLNFVKLNKKKHLRENIECIVMNYCSVYCGQVTMATEGCTWRMWCYPEQPTRRRPAPLSTRRAGYSKRGAGIQGCTYIYFCYCEYILSKFEGPANKAFRATLRLQLIAGTNFSVFALKSFWHILILAILKCNIFVLLIK